MNSYIVDYLENGLTTFVTVNALSKGMAEDVFHETYGEDFEITAIHLDTTKEVA
jgi:hypothetical protein